MLLVGHRASQAQRRCRPRRAAPCVRRPGVTVIWCLAETARRPHCAREEFRLTCISASRPIPTSEYVGYVAAESSQPCVRVREVEFRHLDAEPLRFFILDRSGEIRALIIREPYEFVRSVDNSKNCAFTFLRCGSRHVL
jgi:hypothetical protein